MSERVHVMYMSSLQQTLTSSSVEMCQKINKKKVASELMKRRDKMKPVPRGNCGKYERNILSNAKILEVFVLFGGQSCNFPIHTSRKERRQRNVVTVGSIIPRRASTASC